MKLTTGLISILALERRDWEATVQVRDNGPRDSARLLVAQIRVPRRMDPRRSQRRPKEIFDPLL